MPLSARNGKSVDRNEGHCRLALGFAATDELNVGHYFKRVSSINIQSDDPAFHVLRYAQLDAAA